MTIIYITYSGLSEPSYLEPSKFLELLVLIAGDELPAQ